MTRADVYEKYMSMQSDEWKEDIKGYVPLPANVPLPSGADRNSAIKIEFYSGMWLRAYIKSGYLEWW